MAIPHFNLCILDTYPARVMQKKVPLKHDPQMRKIRINKFKKTSPSTSSDFPAIKQ